MSTLTGDFDLAVELTGSAIQRLIAGMHGAGILRHLYVRAYQNKNVELIINCPQIGFIPAGAPDNITRATATSRVLYHSRNISDATDPGLSVTADAGVRVKLYLTNGDPAPLNSAAYLAADWSETTAADITVHSADQNVVNEVKGALLDFIAAEGGGSYPVPPIGSSPPISSVAFQFLGQGGGVVVGANAGGAIKGSKLQLHNNFVQAGQDWALAISGTYVVSQILASVRAQLGGLPPPHGTSRILLSDTTVCVLPNPFGGCIASADQKIYLESLDITLAAGLILITGSMSLTIYALVPITITANFQAWASLSLGANQSIQVTVSQPSVQLNQWYVQFLNTILGGALTTGISNGIQAAIQSSGGGALSSLISAGTLQSLTSLGGTASVNLSVAMDSVAIWPDTIVVQGSLAVQNLAASPVADVVAVRGASALTMNLNALRSWAPAHQATLFAWNFGDGSAQVYSTSATPAVAVSHTWPAAGQYLVTVTVSDEAGAVASAQIAVKPGVLELLAPQTTELVGPWGVCARTGSFPVTFTVLASGFAAPDAVVVIRTSTSPNRTAVAYTDALGRATFTVDDSMFTAPPPSGSLFEIAGMLVNAFCRDYAWAWNYLWLWQCATIVTGPAELMKRFSGEVTKLSQYAGVPLSAAPGLAQDVALAQQALASLAQLAGRGSSVFPLHMLLGSKQATDQRAQLEKIVDQTVTNLRLLAEAAEKEVAVRRTTETGMRLIDPSQLPAAGGPGRLKAYQAHVANLRERKGPKPGPSRYKISPSRGGAR